MAEPLTAHEACGDVESWLAQPQVTLLHPGEGHASTLFHLLRNLGTAGNLTTDAHLAALAMEYQATLHTPRMRTSPGSPGSSGRIRWGW